MRQVKILLKLLSASTLSLWTWLSVLRVIIR
jgi:hypothetical protein